MLSAARFVSRASMDATTRNNPRSSKHAGMEPFGARWLQKKPRVMSPPRAARCPDSRV